MGGPRQAEKPRLLLAKIRMFLMYVCWPRYRRGVDAEAGWHRVLSTTRYLVKQEWSAGRDEALTILVSKARELSELSRPNSIPRRYGTRPLRRAIRSIRSLRTVIICAECGGSAGENWATCSRCDQRRADEQAGAF
jgi:hypothetical protein